MDSAATIPIEDLSKETFLNIVEQLEASTEFEHFVARKAELDALYRLISVLNNLTLMNSNVSGCRVSSW